MSHRLNILAGKNCLVTGATGGIGRAICLNLSKYGCNLFLTSTNNQKLKDLKKELQKFSMGKICTQKANLASIGDINKLILNIRKKMDHIDVLINNAGVFIVKPLDTLEIEDFKISFDINVMAPFILSKELSRDMIQQEWGRIVNIGSSSAYGCSKDTLAYCMSKHSLLGMTKGLHEELSPHNVRAYFVAPAGTKTEMGEQIKNQNYDTFVSPDEIAEYISFIISFDGTMLSNEIRLNRMILG